MRVVCFFFCNNALYTSDLVSEIKWESLLLHADCRRVYKLNTILSGVIGARFRLKLHTLSSSLYSPPTPSPLIDLTELTKQSVRKMCLTISHTSNLRQSGSEEDRKCLFIASIKRLIHRLNRERTSKPEIGTSLFDQRAKWTRDSITRGIFPDRRVFSRRSLSPPAKG